MAWVQMGKDYSTPSVPSLSLHPSLSLSASFFHLCLLSRGFMSFLSLLHHFSVLCNVAVISGCNR